MKTRTQKKFDIWDKALTENWLEEQPDKAYALLSDPTIYSYAFFRDQDGNPIKLYSYQDAIINSKNKRILFVAANQIGKSYMLVLKALHFALTHPGKTVLLVSKTFPQSKDLLRQIQGMLKMSIIDYKADIGDTETKTEIYFRHYDVEGKELKQSRIICVPATEAALGYAADLLLIDELAFYDDGRYFYFQIAQPRTYHTKGQIIIFSNPNGQQGILWELFNDADFEKYNFNYLDKPGNTKEEYEKLRSKLTREEFDSTVDGAFTSPEGGFLSLDERKKIQVERPNSLPTILTNPIFIFFDFAKSQDRTVRAIGQAVVTSEDADPKVYVHEMKEYPLGTPYNEIIDELVELIKFVGQNNIAMVGWDNTGVGRGIEDFINKIENVGVMCNPVEFSLENKSAIYTLFKLLIENGRITMPFVENCDLQLSKLRFKRTTRGLLQIHHDNERDRDDFPDALAGLCSLIVQPSNVQITAEII